MPLSGRPWRPWKRRDRRHEGRVEAVARGRVRRQIAGQGQMVAQRRDPRAAFAGLQAREILGQPFPAAGLREGRVALRRPERVQEGARRQRRIRVCGDLGVDEGRRLTRVSFAASCGFALGDLGFGGCRSPVGLGSVGFASGPFASAHLGFRNLGLRALASRCGVRARWPRRPEWRAEGSVLPGGGLAAGTAAGGTLCQRRDGVPSSARSDRPAPRRARGPAGRRGGTGTIRNTPDALRRRDRDG